MAAAKSKTTGGQSTNPFGIPNFDLNQVLSQFRLPGLDVSKLMENERKNIEAVQQANQAVTEGWEALSEKQAQMFRETMERWQQAMQDRLAGQQASMEEQAELARKGFEQALENMREMAEIAAQSQSKAYDIMRQRMEENIQAYFQRSDDKTE